jgi:hypothetical protein
MTRFERVEKTVNDLPEANARIAVQNENERKLLEASVAAVSARTGKVEGAVARMKPDVAALSRQVFNRAIDAPVRISRKTDGGAEGGDTGAPNGSPALKPQLPKPRER